jgi:Fic family protein
MRNIGCDIGYRTFPVGTYTSNGFYEYEEYQNIQTKTQNLIDNINNSIVKLSANDSMPKIEDMISICTKWLFEFLQIHPFVDGNGRIARLWMTYLLLPYFPFIINISSGLRENYILSLERKSFKELEATIIESINTHIKNARSRFIGQVFEKLSFVSYFQIV